MWNYLVLSLCLDKIILEELIHNYPMQLKYFYFVFVLHTFRVFGVLFYFFEMSLVKYWSHYSNMQNKQQEQHLPVQQP